MKPTAWLLPMLLSSAALAQAPAIPEITDARNAAAGYAVGTAGFADSLAQVCSKLGEPVAAEMAAARASWHERNGPTVIASLRWIEHGVAQERAAHGEESAALLGAGIKGAIRQQVMASLQGVFPRGAADVNADTCREWAGALGSPESDLAVNTQHGPALVELRAIAWPAP